MSLPRLLIIMLLIAGASRSMADDLADLVAERQQVREQLRTLRERIAAERRDLQRGDDALAARVEAKRQQLAQSEADQAAKAVELAKLRTVTDALEADAAARRQLALAVAESLREALSHRVAVGRQASEEHLALAIDQLSSDASAQQTEGLKTLCDFLGAELRAAQQISLTAAPVTVGERRWPAYRVQVGLAEAYFVSEDGRIVGWAGEHGWELVDDPADRAAIRRLVAMLRGRESAALTPLPLRAPAAMEGGK